MAFLSVNACFFDRPVLPSLFKRPSARRFFDGLGKELHRSWSSYSDLASGLPLVGLAGSLSYYQTCLLTCVPEAVTVTCLFPFVPAFFPIACVVPVEGPNSSKIR